MFFGARTGHWNWLLSGGKGFIHICKFVLLQVIMLNNFGLLCSSVFQLFE